MSYRVIQWATGNVGRAAVQGIRSHPELELVGAWVHSVEKVGRDIGEICGVGPVGIAATDDVDAICAMSADCVLYSPLLPQLDDVVRLLESGKNVVTPGSLSAAIARRGSIASAAFWQQRYRRMSA